MGHGVQLNPQFLVYGNGTLIRELEILRSTSPLRTEEEPNLTVDESSKHPQNPTTNWMHWSNPPRRKNRSRLLAAKRRRAKSEQIRAIRASQGLTDQSRGIPTRRRRSVERCGEEEEGGRAVSLAHVSGEGDPRWRARAEGDLKACSAERAGGRRNRLPLARFALLPSLVTTTMACAVRGGSACLSARLV